MALPLVGVCSGGRAGAIVHLHSTYSVAISCLASRNSHLGRTLNEAVDRTEELEETAKLAAVRGQALQTLIPEQIDEIRRGFGSR